MLISEYMRSQIIKAERVKVEPVKVDHLDVPELKPGYVTNGTLMFAGMSIFGSMALGAAVGTYIFFGVVTLAGIIAIVESNATLKKLATKGSLAIDIGIFGFTVYASAALGVTVAAAFTVAGLGWTLFYARHLRYREALSKAGK